MVEGEKAVSRGEVVEKARSALEGVEGVAFAALMGSIARGGPSYHDVDVAIKVSGVGDRYSVLCDVVYELARALGLPEERIDVVVMDGADPYVKREVLLHGLVLLDRSGYLDELARELDVVYPEFQEMLELDLAEWLSADDPSSIDPVVVKRRLDFVRNERAFLEEHVLERGADEVKRSPVLRRLLERSAHLIVEAMLDVCRHMVSAMGWGPALSYADAVGICVRRGAISQEVGDALSAFIRLRNVIVHRYIDVDYGELYDRARELAALTKELEKQVRDFVRRQLAV